MPTILILGKYRFFFNSREETRMHIHINTADGTAKFWLEPVVSLADFYNMTTKELSELKQITETKQNEFISAWQQHFNQ